ncbi:MAG TPA: EamA family transporter RarD [Rhodocyclaceae bacterium]|nr:EamA family transporter RarD [Rhodocyclaceae bacterium]
MSPHPSPDAARGVAFGLGAYLIWGCFPLFFSLFEGIPAWEVLVHRVIWSCLFLVGLITVLRRWQPVRDALARPRRLGRVLACAVLIGANWGIFIYAVETRQVFQASLGYFLTPLVNVALGMIVLHERMAVLQRWAVALAGVAIAMQFVLLGELPWITLTLALTFGTYGLLRKQITLDGVSGLFVETLLLLPLALVAVAWLVRSGASHFLEERTQSALLVASGVVTALPLLAFAGAARRLRLATLGFLMYVNPTMQFLTALLVFDEALSPPQLVTFVLIWTGLALYSWSAWRTRPRVPAPPAAA